MHSILQANLAIPKEEGTGKSVDLPPQDLPEWLGGLKKSNESSHPQPWKDSVPIRPDAELRTETAQNPAYQLPDYSERFSALAGTQFDQQATMMSLQQQEHELRTAATLSKQSEQLNKMIESQRNRLNDQEKQFNLLIKRQIDRQELLEGQMKAQQDRINSHLQVRYFATFDLFCPPFSYLTYFSTGIIGSAYFRSNGSIDCGQ